MDPQVITELLKFIGKFLPCRTLFGFKLQGLMFVVGAVAVGWSFKLVWNFRQLKFSVDGPDVGIAIAALATLILLTIINAVLKDRRDRLLERLVRLTRKRGCPKDVRDQILRQLASL